MLVDGKLQIWQFFAYKQEKHFPFYWATEFNDKIFLKFDGPSVAIHGASGNKALARGTSIFENKFSHSLSFSSLFSGVFLWLDSGE